MPSTEKLQELCFDCTEETGKKFLSALSSKDEKQVATHPVQCKLLRLCASKDEVRQLFLLLTLGMGVHPSDVVHAIKRHVDAGIHMRIAKYGAQAPAVYAEQVKAGKAFLAGREAPMFAGVSA